jgi:ribosomal protein S18 acetylase RimI-like enzyme
MRNNIIEKDSISFRHLNKNDDFELLISFAENNKDFFFYQDGVSDPKKIASSIFDDMPKDIDQNNKWVIGVFRNQICKGVLDCIHHYPKENELCIGLFIIDEKSRAYGLGKSLYKMFESYLKSLDIYKLSIGVIETNQKALSFWHHLGYIDVKKIEMDLGLRKHIIITMHKNI